MKFFPLATLFFFALGDLALGVTTITRFDVSRQNRAWRPNLPIGTPTFDLGTVVNFIHTDEGDFVPPVRTFSARQSLPVEVHSTSEGLVLEFAHTSYLPGNATEDFFIQYRSVYGNYYNYETQVAFLYDEPLLFEVQPDGITATLSGFASLQYPGPVLMFGATPGSPQNTPVPLLNGTLVPFSLSVVNRTGPWAQDSFAYDINYDLVGFYDFTKAIPEPTFIACAVLGLLPMLQRKRSSQAS